MITGSDETAASFNKRGFTEGLHDAVVWDTRRTNLSCKGNDFMCGYMSY